MQGHGKRREINLQLETCNLQLATCNLQPATCNLQPATCNLQLATCNLNLYPTPSIGAFPQCQDIASVDPFIVHRIHKLSHKQDS